jgi:MFS family permease
MSPRDTTRRVIVVYLTLNSLFTLGASLIWAINTIFLLQVGGLDLFQVMLVNSVFTVAQMVFEVPTGVIADTIGRRASIVLSMATLAASTVLYVLTPGWGWGIWGFMFASVLLGLGYTFQTGASDAWLVDALDATGWTGPKDRVFAWGQIAWGVGMMTGSLLGGVLGQFNLVWPYLGRGILLGVCFVVALFMVHDLGFEPRPLRAATFGDEMRRIFSGGVHYGWRSPVVRPLLWTSAISGLFMMYGFYAWQPYVLELLGRDYVWLLGVVQAASSAVGIVGNALVGRIMGKGENRRDPARVLVAAALVNAAFVLGIGAVGIVAREPGIVPAGAAIAMWLGWGIVYGISGPVRMSFINEHIPSSQRATVLSLDAFFSDAGGAVGQPALGWLSERVSISFAWLIGGGLVGLTAPLYAKSGDAAREHEERFELA